MHLINIVTTDAVNTNIMIIIMVVIVTDRVMVDMFFAEMLIEKSSPMQSSPICS